MAANSFLKYYEASYYKLGFDWLDFIENDFEDFTSTKQKLDVFTSDSDFVKNARDVIIYNFSQNIYFEKKTYAFQTLKELKNLLQKSNEIIDDDIILRLTFLLHFSKVKIEQEDFETHLKLINTLEIKQNEYFPEIKTLFQDLIHNKNIKKALLETFNGLLNQNVSDFDLSKLEVKYFTTSIDGLCGLSGLNTIYVSLYEIEKIMIECNKRFTENQGIDIVKLHCIKLYVHECMHILLRNSTTNFNFSTPELFKENKELKEKFSIQESGHIADRKIFNQNIDWLESCGKRNENFDILYCQNFLQSFLTGSETIKFDPKLAYTVAVSDKEPLMGMNFVIKLRFKSSYY